MKKLTFLVLLFSFTVCAVQAQTPVDTSLEAVALRETVISANRVHESRAAVAQQVQVLKRPQIEQLNAQTTADMLQNSGAVFLQKSQQGGGSPVLRGFEASRVVMVVDGVRMNNAIYRAGHLQNSITLDNAALERAEILFGPASTLYGTDALGGAICFYTKNPTFATAGERFKTTGNAFFRYGTVNEEKTAHADLSLGGQKLGSLTSFTFSDFGDLRMGKQNGFSSFFGKRDFYVERINGRDSLVRNGDPYVQKFTGYQQYDLLEKIIFRPDANSSHTLNVQFSNSGDIPRYDRLTDPGSNGRGLNSAEWYYGPQKRLMAAYTFGLNRFGWFDGGLRATASWQDIEESRHNRNFGAPNRTNRIEKVKVVGLTLDAQKNWARQTLHLGLDGQYNDVTSTANRYNLVKDQTTPQSTRYPDGGSTMTNAALYLTHTWHSADETWYFSEGIRGGFSSLKAQFRDTTFFSFPFDEVTQQNPVISGSLGAVWNGATGWRVALSAASGFRSPNVDDLAKVFETQAGSVIVPNPNLKPEKTYNLDLNVTRSITDRLRWENVLWVTAFRDAIVTDVFQFGGQDSIDYDGVRSRVLANQNRRKANLWGLTTGLEADVYDNLALYGSIAYTRGRIVAEEGDDVPLDHIPPVYGRLGFRYHTSRATVEVFSLFNGRKEIKDYNLGGEDNQQYAPPNGLPGWLTLNLRGGYKFGRFIALQAGLDNILDTQYRTFASGINAPGRNFFVTLRLAW